VAVEVVEVVALPAIVSPVSVIVATSAETRVLVAVPEACVVFPEVVGLPIVKSLAVYGALASFTIPT